MIFLRQLIILPVTAYVVNFERLGQPGYWQIWSLAVFDRDCKTPVASAPIRAPTPARSAGPYSAVEVKDLISATRARSSKEHLSNPDSLNETRFITWCDKRTPCSISLEIYSSGDADDLCFFWSQDAETLRVTLDSRDPVIWNNPRYAGLSCRHTQSSFKNMICSSETKCTMMNDECEEGYVGVPKTCTNGTWSPNSVNRCVLSNTRWRVRASAAVQYLEVRFFSDQCTEPVLSIPGRTGVAYSEYGDLKSARRVFDGDFETYYQTPMDMPAVEFRFRLPEAAATIDCAKVNTAPFKGSIILERLEERGWVTVSASPASTRYQELHILQATPPKHPVRKHKNETEPVICAE